jgi:hypothetical protein
VAVGLEPAGVDVLTVCPGFVTTNMTENLNGKVSMVRNVFISSPPQRRNWHASSSDTEIISVVLCMVGNSLDHGPRCGHADSCSHEAQGLRYTVPAWPLPLFERNLLYDATFFPSCHRAHPQAQSGCRERRLFSLQRGLKPDEVKFDIILAALYRPESLTSIFVKAFNHNLDRYFPGRDEA